MSLPIFAFDMHAVCNQRCSYCIAGSALSHDFGPIADDKRVEIEAFFQAVDPMNILLTGGEPMLTPDLQSFLHRLLDSGHKLSMQTNLRLGADDFMATCPPERVGWILATLHSVALKRTKQFVAHVAKLLAAGYPILVKLVLDETTMAELESLHEALTAAGAGVILSPVVHVRESGLVDVERYDVDQWKRIAPRVSLLSSWLYFSGGFQSSGRRCLAGSRCFYGRAANGRLSGCAHSFPPDLGSMYNDAFQPEDEPVTCELKQCVCDFNYYTGIIDGVDDSQGLARLRKGDNSPVAFTEFTAWLQRANVTPRLDLQAWIAGSPNEVRS